MLHMPIHDHFRANDAKTAMLAMKRLVGQLGPEPAFDGVVSSDNQDESQRQSG
jgi:hypothetical protein